MIRSTIFPIFALLGLFTLSAAPTAANLTPEEAVSAALANNAQLKTARYIVAIATAEHELAGRRDAPRVNLSYATDWVFNDDGQATLGIGINQAFPLTRRLSILKDIAAKEIEIARAEIRDQERLLAADVERAFASIHYLDAQLAFYDELLQINARSLKYIQSGIARAESSELDANNLRLEAISLRHAAQKIRNERIATLARLSELVGHTDRHTVEIRSNPTYTHDAPPAALIEGDESILKTHPQRQIHQLFLELATERTALTRASRWEDIVLGVSLENERAIDAPNGLASDRFLGLRVSIPLPAKRKNQAAVAAQLSREDQARQSLRALDLELHHEAVTFRQRALSLHEQLEAFEREALPLLTENLQQVAAAYEAGQIPLANLFQAQSQSLELRTHYLELRNDYKRTLIDWRAATATPLTR